MPPLTTALLGQACRIFLQAAYPDGPASAPANKQPYWQVADDAALEPLLTPSQGVCQACPAGFTFRLGSNVYPNLKLKAQCLDASGAGTWVFSVDTHDAFSNESFRPPPDHPDAQAWLALQSVNQALKELIEHAWEHAGLITHNEYLRRELLRTPEKSFEREVPA